MYIPNAVASMISGGKQMNSAMKRRDDLRGVSSGAPGAGTDLFITQRGGTGALADWTGSSEAHRRTQVEYASWFAVHVMSSMTLAGLDRSYGSLHEETDRVLRASSMGPQPSANVVVDFALMRKLREVSTSSLQLEVDNPARRVAGISAEVLHATTDVLRSFLLSKKSTATPAFEAILGVTDPDDRLRKLGRRVNESDRIVTASLQTFLALTLCDPYAYGMSPSRAIHAFLASTLARAKIRNENSVDESVWPLTELDHQIMLAPEITNVGDEEFDESTMKSALAAIQRMHAFKAYMKCAMRHRATAAHRTNPKFHAMYTILKATYIVHVSVSWLQRVLMAQMELEEKQDAPGAEGPKPHAFLTAEATHVLENQLDELGKIRAKFQRGSLSTADKAGAYIALVRCAWAIRTQSRTVALSDGAAFDFVVKPTTKHISATRYGPDDIAKAYTEYNEVTPQSADDEKASALRSVRSFADAVGQSNVGMQYAATLQLPSERIRQSSGSISMSHATEVVEDSNENELEQLAKVLEAYVRLLFVLSYSGEQTEQRDGRPCPAEGGCAEQRMYKLASPLLILSRTYAFLHRLFAATGAHATAKVPEIVTMIREAGWGGKDRVSNMRYTESFAKQFDAFTMTMGHGILYCHNTMDDTTRGLLFGTAMQKLRDSNLTLMAMVQRRVLETTPDCHPFRHGNLTQLTLQASVVAQMLPSDRILPLDWTTAQKLKMDHDAALRALMGSSTFTRLQEEDGATVGLLKMLTKSTAPQFSSVLKHMKSVAFSGRRT